MPKRYTYNSCGDFFWAKQEEHETPEEHWRKLVSLERNCEVIGIKQKDLLLSKFITRSTDEKKPGKSYPRKNTKPQNQQGPRDPRQLREKKQTVNDTHSTGERKRDKTQNKYRKYKNNKTRVLGRQK